MGSDEKSFFEKFGMPCRPIFSAMPMKSQNSNTYNPGRKKRLVSKVELTGIEPVAVQGEKSAAFQLEARLFAPLALSMGAGGDFSQCLGFNWSSVRCLSIGLDAVLPALNIVD